MKRFSFIVSVALSAVVAIAWLAAPSAQACGGFFCNGQTQTPIYQAGERILFAAHGNRVTMHIEVNYEGDDPTEFAWLLPVPEQPTNNQGDPLPLDEAVTVSSPTLFDTLQAQTDPQFRRIFNGIVDPYDCRDWLQDGAVSAPSFSNEGGRQDASAGPGGGGEPPPVAVLEEAKVGPYNAQLIQATDADALYEWLNENGYQQDENARPILGHYVAESFLFVGIKLQSGNTADKIKPLALTFGEDAPCVPLRLTSIAATSDMPIFVWVLGQGRAVPKNFIHAQVNDQAIAFPSASNYVQVVNEAVDTASGRAWVTEFASTTENFQGDFLPQNARNADAAQSAESLQELWDAIVPLANLPQTRDLLREEIPMPEGLMGYPHGNCYYDPWFEEGGYYEYWYYPCEEENEDHQTTEAEFYNYLGYWIALAAEDEALTIDVDLDVLKDRFMDEVYTPLDRIEDLFAEASHITRFYTTQSGEEMTKDPIFAFNPTLPEVPRMHQAEITEYWGWDCRPYKIVQYPDGRRYTFDDCGDTSCNNSTVDPVPGADSLLYPEVVDEWGDPTPFKASQSLTVDGTLMGDAGMPSMPDDFPFETPETFTEKPTWPNPPPGYYVNFPEEKAMFESPENGSTALREPEPAGLFGCMGGLATGGFTWLLLGLGYALWLRRRRAPVRVR